MGYEIRLIIGKKVTFNDRGFMEIARVDLSKIGSGKLDDLIKYAQGKYSKDTNLDFLKGIRSKHLGVPDETGDLFGVGNSYIHVDIWEGSDRVTEDLYGDPLPAIPLDHVLAAINKEMENSDYRRFELAKNILEAFNNSKWDRIYVVPYGH